MKPRIRPRKRDRAIKVGDWVWCRQGSLDEIKWQVSMILEGGRALQLHEPKTDFLTSANTAYCKLILPRKKKAKKDKVVRFQIYTTPDGAKVLEKTHKVMAGKTMGQSLVRCATELFRRRKLF